MDSIEEKLENHKLFQCETDLEMVNSKMNKIK